MCLLTVRPERCSPPMTVYKGKWTPKTQAAINGHFPVGSEVAYSCLEGYRLVGAEMLKCTADRLWSKIPPICVPQSGRTYSCACDVCVCVFQNSPICVLLSGRMCMWLSLWCACVKRVNMYTSFASFHLYTVYHRCMLLHIKTHLGF